MVIGFLVQLYLDQSLIKKAPMFISAVILLFFLFTHLRTLKGGLVAAISQAGKLQACTYLLLVVLLVSETGLGLLL